MPTVTVTHDVGDRFDIAIRGHVVHVDQPESDGGSDTGPTPTELFVASLASCVAFYAAGTSSSTISLRRASPSLLRPSPVRSLRASPA